MRQVLSLRFLGALLAVAVFGVLAVLVTRGGDDLGGVADASPRLRRADLVASVAAVERVDFEMTPFGTVSGTLILDLPVGENIERIQVFPGTPGDITCTDLDVQFRCAVMAELLGDSIVSFRLVPVQTGLRLDLPAIVGFADGYAELADGWTVPYVATIDRSDCDPDVASFTELRTKYGDDFVSVYDLAEGRIVRVKNCGATTGNAPATVPATTLATA